MSMAYEHGRQRLGVRTDRRSNLDADAVGAQTHTYPSLMNSDDCGASAHSNRLASMYDITVLNLLKYTAQRNTELAARSPPPRRLGDSRRDL
jgi:hypothetical protein